MDPRTGELYPTLKAAQDAGVDDAVEITGTEEAIKAISTASCTSVTCTGSGSRSGGWRKPRGRRTVASHDVVNHPPHYTAHPSGVECITITEHMGFCIGNAVKYLWRADLKGDSIIDLEKAAWYVNREIERRREARIVDAEIAEDSEDMRCTATARKGVRCVLMAPHDGVSHRFPLEIPVQEVDDPKRCRALWKSFQCILPSGHPAWSDGVPHHYEPDEVA